MTPALCFLTFLEDLQRCSIACSTCSITCSSSSARRAWSVLALILKTRFHGRTGQERRLVWLDRRHQIWLLVIKVIHKIVQWIIVLSSISAVERLLIHRLLLQLLFVNNVSTPLTTPLCAWPWGWCDSWWSLVMVSQQWWGWMMRRRRIGVIIPTSIVTWMPAARCQGNIISPDPWTWHLKNVCHPWLCIAGLSDLFFFSWSHLNKIGPEVEEGENMWKSKIEKVSLNKSSSSCCDYWSIWSLGNINSWKFVDLMILLVQQSFDCFYLSWSIFHCYLQVLKFFKVFKRLCQGTGSIKNFFLNLDPFKTLKKVQNSQNLRTTNFQL